MADKPTTDERIEPPKYYVPTPPIIRKAIGEAWVANQKYGKSAMSYAEFMDRCNEIGVASHIASGMVQHICLDVVRELGSNKAIWRHTVKKRGKELNRLLTQVSAQEHIYGGGDDSDDYYEQLVDDLYHEMKPHGMKVRIQMSNHLLQHHCTDTRTAQIMFTAMALTVTHLGSITARIKMHFTDHILVQRELRGPYTDVIFRIFSSLKMLSDEVLKGIKCDGTFEVPIPEGVAQGDNDWELDCGENKALYTSLRLYARYIDDPQTWTRLAFRENVRAYKKGDLDGRLLAFDPRDAIDHGWLTEEEIIEAFGHIPEFQQNAFDTDKKERYERNEKLLYDEGVRDAIEKVNKAVIKHTRLRPTEVKLPRPAFDELFKVLGNVSDIVKFLVAIANQMERPTFPEVLRIAMETAKAFREGRVEKELKKAKQPSPEDTFKAWEINKLDKLKPRVRRVLHDNGINTIGDILNYKLDDMLQWKGFGPKSLENLNEAMRAIGASTRDRRTGEWHPSEGKLALRPTALAEKRMAL